MAFRTHTGSRSRSPGLPLATIPGLSWRNSTSPAPASSPPSDPRRHRDRGARNGRPLTRKAGAFSAPAMRCCKPQAWSPPGISLSCDGLLDAGAALHLCRDLVRGGVAHVELGEIDLPLGFGVGLVLDAALDLDVIEADNAPLGLGRVVHADDELA